MSTNAFLRAAGLGLGALFAVTTTIACGPAGETGTGGSGGSGSGGSGGSGGTGGDACVIGEPTAQPTLLTKLAEPDFGLWSGMEHREGDLLLFEQGKLVSVPVAGGAAVTLASDATIESFSFFAAVAGDAVIYAGNDLQLRSLPLAGGPSAAVVKSHQINGVMATDPTRSTVYWHAFADPNMSGLNVATGKNEPVCPIPAGSRVGGSLVHDSREGKDHLYWAGIDEQERWIVARCEVGAETSEILATLASEAKPELAIAGEHLYWVDDSHDDSGLRRIPLDGGDMEMLDPDASRPIHSTGDAVYYAGWDGEVRKLGAGQSCPVVLAAVESKYHTLSAFTSDDSKLYGIATDGQMFAVSR